MKFGCNWQKIGHKGRCRKDSERTFLKKGGRVSISIPFKKRKMYENLTEYKITVIVMVMYEG